MESLRERAKRNFVQNQKRIDDPKTTKEERRFLIQMNKLNLKLLKSYEKEKK